MNAPLQIASGWYSAQDLAGLPGMPGTERRVRSRAEKNLWPARPKERGKGLEYPLSALPSETQRHLLSISLSVSSAATSQDVAAFPANQPASGKSAEAGLLIPHPGADVLTDKQRAERDARAAVLSAIRNLQANSGCSQEAAMTTLLTTAKAGRLEPVLDGMLRKARDPRGRSGDGYPSIRTLKRWLKAPDLTPRVVQKEMTVPTWAPALMKLYGQPQKPSLSWCMEKLPENLPAGVTCPSYDAARRFLDKVGAITKQRGRMLPRALKTLRPFIRRDTSELLPGDYYTADGHTFDAEVAHPDHGRPFRPEITGVIDIATKKCVGWSAGLAESTWTVMDAQRNAFETNGLCAGWYVDRGSGFFNAMQSDEVSGFAARCGYQIHHSLPYNSQARGIGERSHQSMWVRGAKSLPTYIGAQMDAEAKNKVFKITRAQIKATGTSEYLMPFEAFTRWCQQEADAYNNRPHRGLPKIFDEEKGRKRHMTPNEAWQQAIDAGWEPVMLTDAERADLFRPEKVCTILRGEIRLRNNLYFSRELEEFHGEKMRVGYDIHDASRVWVRDMEGRLVCIAEFEANKRAYFPLSVRDQDRAKRATARERRLEIHLQEVRDELNPPALLEHQAPIYVPDVMPADGIAVEAQAQRLGDAEVIALREIEERPWFTNDPDQYRWLMRNPAQWTRDDAAWLMDYAASEDYADLADRYAFQGVAWGDEDEARARAKLEGFEVAAG